MAAPAQKVHPVVKLTRMVSGLRLPRALQVAARLGVGKRLRAGPRSAAKLAQETGNDARALSRLLRLLAEHGIVEEIAADTFGPTELSDHLHLVDIPSLGEEDWATWAALPDALRTGTSVFERVHGATFYAYHAQHPSAAAGWNDWNTATGESWLPPVVDALQLNGAETVVDVGGGQGNLLVEVLKRHAGCRGVLFDLPSVVAGASPILAAAGVGPRCEIVGGDAFTSVPHGGDVYTISRVLLNWDDEHVVKLLTRCADGMGPASRLMAVDILMPEKGDPRRPLLAANDIHLFLTFGGGHRTHAEMKRLFATARLEITRVTPAPSATASWDVIEARRL